MDTNPIDVDIDAIEEELENTEWSHEETYQDEDEIRVVFATPSGAQCILTEADDGYFRELATHEGTNILSFPRDATDEAQRNAITAMKSYSL